MTPKQATSHPEWDELRKDVKDIGHGLLTVEGRVATIEDKLEGFDAMCKQVTENTLRGKIMWAWLAFVTASLSGLAGFLIQEVLKKMLSQ
jgi:hypothetical protein